jgi:hypothetical protein
MSEQIKNSVEYLNLTDQGIPDDVAWGAVWIDRAYNHLVRSGMGGAEAYAHAVSTWAASNLNLESMPPEAVIYKVTEQRHQALTQFANLDPQQPEASFVLQYRPFDQQKSP